MLKDRSCSLFLHAKDSKHPSRRRLLKSIVFALSMGLLVGAITAAPAKTTYAAEEDSEEEDTGGYDEIEEYVETAIQETDNSYETETAYNEENNDSSGYESVAVNTEPAVTYEEQEQSNSQTEQMQGAQTPESNTDLNEQTNGETNQGSEQQESDSENPASDSGQENSGGTESDSTVPGEEDNGKKITGDEGLPNHGEEAGKTGDDNQSSSSSETDPKTEKDSEGQKDPEDPSDDKDKGKESDDPSMNKDPKQGETGTGEENDPGKDPKTETDNKDPEKDPESEVTDPSIDPTTDPDPKDDPEKKDGPNQPGQEQPDHPNPQDLGPQEKDPKAEDPKQDEPKPDEPKTDEPMPQDDPAAPSNPEIGDDPGNDNPIIYIDPADNPQQGEENPSEGEAALDPDKKDDFKPGDLIPEVTDPEKKDEEKKEETTIVADKMSTDATPGVTGSNDSGDYSGGSYYGGSYYNGYSAWQNAYNTWYASLSSYQKLLVGMQQIGKRYAVAAEAMNVYDDKTENGNVIGTMTKGNMCFILADADEEWVYIESGEVRGFVLYQNLITGIEAEKRINETGENMMLLATASVLPAQNRAFRYKLVTTEIVPQQPAMTTQATTGTLGGLFGNTTANRGSVVTYAKQFLGRPYVWGGEDLWNGTDCSGFVKGVYSHFGITLPRASYEQCYSGTRIPVTDALPGDLIFYANDGVVFHVVLYIGNGQGISAESAQTGIAISNINYDLACWACRFLPDTDRVSTQASDLIATGKLAYHGDEVAQQKIVDALAAATEGEWETYGLARSVLIAQTIQDSGWLTFQNESNGGIKASDNNVLNMNAELMDSKWTSPWTGESAVRTVPKLDDGKIVYTKTSMRTYEDMEACLDDYAAFKVGLHPELKGETNIDTVINTGLRGYADNQAYQSSIKQIIQKFDLTQYDVVQTSSQTQGLQNVSMGTGRTDPRQYTQQQYELIWAIVAQEDDHSYEGALAVITSVMNRADQNYNGYGADALSQITADGQYCYSPSVSDPIYYQRRLGGNVPEFVKQAVSDCLVKGIRNHSFLNFRSSNRTGYYVRIGGNWYF